MDTVKYLETVFPELKEKVSYQAYGYSQLKTSSSQNDRYGGSQRVNY
ncbi:MAG: hypothetical protein LBI53_02025 [Candidatus Peribacteria bacterium]|jgi:hypothetical protein|nr:hypothetical protein [Candidatus Peribacteria bacterium]